MLQSLLEYLVNEVLPRLLGSAVHSRWFVQWRLKINTEKRITLLIARLDGDNTSGALRETIIDAIKRQIYNSVAVYRWPDSLTLDSGIDEEAEERARKKALSWLRKKRCDLLIWGRVKADNIISLRFTPAEKDEAQPQTYVLTSGTLELPAKFITDLGVSIAAYVTSNVKNAAASGRYMVPTLRALADRLDAITKKGGEEFGLATIGSLKHCHAFVLIKLYEQSRTVDDLEASISLNREALVIRTRASVPDEWAVSQNNLGTALARLGHVSGERKYFNDAIKAFQASLEERSPQKSLVRWTGTQINIASVFSELGRQAGNIANIEEANFIYDLIITAELREADARLWAMAQNNRGLVLLTLSSRQIGESYLQQALDAFTEALEVITLDESPIDWANTKSNFGVALLELGDRRNNPAPYEAAAGHFKDALKVFDKRRSPGSWAIIQGHMGLALSLVGSSNDDATLLRRAIVALNASLTVIDKARDLVGWRKAKRNLGRALSILGARDDEDISILDKAVAALGASLAETPREEAPREWQSTMVDLGWTLQRIGEREPDTNRLRDAQSTFQEVLESLTSEVSPIDWTSAMSGLGCTLRALGELQNDTGLLRQSIIYFERTFEVVSVTSHQVRWAVSHLDIAKAYSAISELESNDEYADLCREECTKALAAYSGQAPVKLANEVENVLARLERGEGH
jgi:tetratricopeptide (TPR) repeat protein